MSDERTYIASGAGALQVFSAPVSLAASGNSSNFRVAPASGDAVAILAVGAGTGTLAAKLQESDDGSTNWTDVPNGAFANNTGTPGTQQLTIRPDERHEYLRIAYTVTTGPFLVSACLLSLPDI